MQLKNKTIFLTGATGGIGQEVAHLLADNETKLVLIGRNQMQLDKLQETLSKITKSTSRMVTLCADISTKTGRQKIIDEATASKIDVLINLAGVNQLALLSQMSDGDIDSLVRTNLTSPIQLTKHLIPLLQKQGESAIINVGSILGSIGYAGSSSYCASKFGLRGFSEALRRELADTSIDVIYLAPRTTNTAMNNDHSNAMNKALGNAVDDPKAVAKILLSTLKTKKNIRYIGWPEKLFVQINALFPSVVDNSVKKQLSTIKQYLSQPR